MQCHADAVEPPHAAQLAPVTCTSGCHESEAIKYRRGTHAAALAAGVSDAPGCATCHGSHDVKPPNNRASPTHPLNEAQLCGDWRWP